MDKVNIFLDSTTLYVDPLFKSSFSKLLLELQSEGRIDIFISKVVHNESSNNYEKQLKDAYHNIKKETEKLNTLTIENQNPSLKNISTLVKEYSNFYEENFQRGSFNLVEYDENILPQLIQRSIQRIKPFTDARQEFRDAIIWISYVALIKNNSLKKNYFITNNKRDFWDDKNTELHPELRKEVSDLTVYSNFQELLTKESAILEIIKEKNFSDWLNNNEPSSDEILEIIKNKLWTQLKDNIGQKIDRLKPELYFPDVKASYFEYVYEKSNLKLKHFSVKQISNFGYVECLVLLDSLAIIYPIERQWTKEKKAIVFSINLSFIFDLNMKITDHSVSNVSITYDKSNTDVVES